MLEPDQSAGISRIFCRISMLEFLWSFCEPNTKNGGVIIIIIIIVLGSLVKRMVKMLELLGCFKTCTVGMLELLGFFVKHNQNAGVLRFVMTCTVKRLEIPGPKCWNS